MKERIVVGMNDTIIGTVKNPIKLYHGNKDANMVPFYGKGLKDNDYGRGFYTGEIINE